LVICGKTGDVHANAVPAATAPNETIKEQKKEIILFVLKGSAT